MQPNNFLSSLASYGTSSVVPSEVPNYFQNLVQTGQVPDQAASSFGSWFKDSGFLGSQNPGGTASPGWGMPVIAAGQGIMNAFLGMKQYGLYKDQLNESKRQFGLNFDAQKTTTNAALEDRQRARVASNAGAYQSVGDYMASHGIKG